MGTVHHTDARVRTLLHRLERKHLSLGEYRKALIMLLVEEEGQTTVHDAMDLLGVNRETARDLLHELRLEGKLRVTGPHAATHPAVYEAGMEEI